jgi:hypothetical protein
MSSYLKVAGWNVLRAAAARSVIEKLATPSQTALFAQWRRTLSLFIKSIPALAAA